MTRIAYIAPELGAVTSTFVYRELFALRQLGVMVVPYGTYPPASQVVSEEARNLIQTTLYLYNSAFSAILLAVFEQMLRHPIRFISAVGMLLRDMLCARMPRSLDRLKVAWQFAMACVMCRGLKEQQASHIHAHFAHVPTSIAMYAAKLTGGSFSFTAHANDLFERPSALLEKTTRAAFVVCISEYNRRFLSEQKCPTERVHIIHCGLDTDRYPFMPPHRTDGPVRILSVGRFVEKKGFDVLVRALVVLEKMGCPFVCSIVGDGPLSDNIKKQTEQANIGNKIRFLGGLPQQEVKHLFEQSDIFVLPCVQAKSGDLDGIPVVLMEAMAIGVPVVSTTLSGIPELIHHDHNGLLSPPGDSDELVHQLRRLIDDPDMALRLAVQARKTIEQDFNIRKNAEKLSTCFQNITKLLT